MTSPNDFQGAPLGQRPSSFDEWLQAFREQASFFTGVTFGGTGSATGAPRWPLADVLPVLPFIGAAVGLVAGLVFAIVRSIAGSGWLAEPIDHRMIGAVATGWAAAPYDLPASYDLLVFFDKSTASALLPPHRRD